MKSQVSPSGGAPQRRDRAAKPVRPAQCRAVRGQDLPNLLGPLGPVPWLHRNPAGAARQPGGPEFLQAGV